jgi:hypothetical protein
LIHYPNQGDGVQISGELKIGVKVETLLLTGQQQLIQDMVKDWGQLGWNPQQHRMGR